MKQLGSLRSTVVYFLCITVALVLFSGFVVYHKKSQIGNHFRIFITQRFEQTFGLTVVLEGIEGNVFGTVALKGVQLSVPSAGGSVLTIFSADEVRFRYTLGDFFRENFSGWFDIILKKPVFYSNIPFRPAVREARSLEFFSAFTQRVRQNARLIVEDGTIAWLGEDGILSGIEGVIENEAFDFKLSLNHIRLENLDVTTTMAFKGRVMPDPDHASKKLVGSWTTQGTVVNWKPVPKESMMRFEITEDQFIIHDATILGGIEIEGVIGHTSREDVDLKLVAKRYPLRQIYDILSFSNNPSMGGTMDGQILLSGSLHHPRIHGQILIENPDSNAERFKNIQLNFSGIYPTVRLSQSRMVTQNGTVMKFSNQELHVQELLDVTTYEDLVRRTEQTMVTWGDWTLKRQEEEDSVSLEHGFGEDLKLTYERLEHDETRIHHSESKDKFHLEYLLGGKQSVKMEVKEDEQFFGLQRKSVF